MEPNPPGPGQQSQRQAPVYDPNVGGHYGLFASFNERSSSSASTSSIDGVLMLTNFLKQVQAQRYVMLKHGLNANAVALQMANLVDDCCSFLRRALPLWRNCIRGLGQM